MLELSSDVKEKNTGRHEFLEGGWMVLHKPDGSSVWGLPRNMVKYPEDYSSSCGDGLQASKKEALGR